jgi:hypothetical protein
VSSRPRFRGKSPAGVASWCRSCADRNGLICSDMLRSRNKMHTTCTDNTSGRTFENKHGESRDG